MGAAYSEQDYSDWERTYVTADHGGRSVLSSFASVSDNQFYDMVVNPESIPLLYVHSVRNVGNLRMSWGHPTSAAGAITFVKTDDASDQKSNDVTVTVPVPANVTELDLSSYRALFVAYRDCLVHLEATISLPGVNDVRLSSMLIKDI